MGRITRDLTLTYSANSTAILKFNLAVPRKKKGETDFINCVAFGKSAENINQFFTKGNMIAITGHIQTGSYDSNDGKKVYTTDVIVDEWDFTGEKSGTGQQNHESEPTRTYSDMPAESGDGFYLVDDESDPLPF